MGKCLSKAYTSQHMSTRGDEIAQFRLGSTVVLVFEAPRDFEFSIVPDQKIQMGQGIGAVSGENPATTFPTNADVIRLARCKTRSVSPMSEKPVLKEQSKSIQKVDEKSFRSTDSHKLRKHFQGLGPAYTKGESKNKTLSDE